jgi:uncharacterized protein (DUF983 family)
MVCYFIVVAIVILGGSYSEVESRSKRGKIRPARAGVTRVLQRCYTGILHGFYKGVTRVKVRPVCAEAGIAVELKES